MLVILLGSSLNLCSCERIGNADIALLAGKKGSIVGSDGLAVLGSLEGETGDIITKSLTAGNLDINGKDTVSIAVEGSGHGEVLGSLGPCLDVRNILVDELILEGIVELEVGDIHMILSLGSDRNFNLLVNCLALDFLALIVNGRNLGDNPLLSLGVDSGLLGNNLDLKRIVEHRRSLETLDTVDVGTRDEDETRLTGSGQVDLDSLFALLYDEDVLLSVVGDGCTVLRQILLLGVGNDLLAIDKLMEIPATGLGIGNIELAVLASSASCAIGNIIGLAIREGELPSTVLSCERSDTCDHSTSVDRALKRIDVSLESTKRVLDIGDLGLKIIDVLVVVCTRYSYACETQNEGSCKEQIFDFFVHSTKNKIDKVDNT